MDSDINKNDVQKTKICRKCGRELPLDQFRIETGKNYTRTECRSCEVKYSIQYMEKKREIKFRKNAQTLIRRQYKTIPADRILDIAAYGIEQCAEDEIFVKMEDCINLWISNYGRGISNASGEYKLLVGNKNKSSGIVYNTYVSVVEDGVCKKVQKYLHAAPAVVKTFIENPDCVNNTFTWHKGFNKDDYYYKNLYPLTKDQYYAVRRNYLKTGDDSEEFILKVMNDIDHLPPKWRKEWVEPKVCNIGYHGCDDPDFKSVSYNRWKNMIHRCYNVMLQETTYAAYKDCTVCEEWHNYSNFRAWFDSHIYQCDGKQMDVDKDILFPGNKIYSPGTCCIVPQKINLLVAERKGLESKYPTGIYQCNNGFRVDVRFGGKEKTIGTYDTVDEAVEIYKSVKEKYIHDVAEKYKGKIPEIAYQSLKNWTVEITD